MAACAIRPTCMRCRQEKPKQLMTYYSRGWLCHRCEWILEQKVDMEDREE